MGSDLVKALSNPIVSAVHDCAQISSESDCNSGGGRCHAKAIAPATDDSIEAEIDTHTKEKG